MKNNFELSFNIMSEHIYLIGLIFILVGLIESEIGEKAEIKFEGMQPGDVKRTFADIEHSKQKLNYTPTTKIVEGIPKFIDWFKKYNK